jgi:uncharacterized protein YndB with AHSA1/START domain
MYSRWKPKPNNGGAAVTSAGEPVVVEIHIEAEPGTVFEFFVDADKLSRWLAESATLDPQPGGVCRQDHVGETGKPSFHMLGEFLEVDPPKRVVFTWGFEEPEVRVPVGSSRVEVTLRAVGRGTHLRLEHHELPASEVASHAEGWTEMLSRLATAVDRQATHTSKET